ncbi:MAG: helix-turn-helix domain-containing protein [Bacillota bacterium]|jgi:transcriptional regulator with XRE-family HTH domain
MDIGAKIKDIRMQNGLTQEELANRAELTKGFISQVERNLTSISISTLTDVLECLGTNLQEFFSDTAEEKIVFGAEDFFEKQDIESGIDIRWIVPNSQKNDMEPIIITLAGKTQTAADDPHPGEEFGYVLKGGVILHLGQKKYRAKKGECFYYRADTTHFLENTASSPAVVLWISSPPMF